MEPITATIPGWVRYFEALAVPGLAATAVLWELWRWRLRRKGFDARISAHAYALRRQLREWLDEPWPDDPASRVHRARELTAEKPLDRAEVRSLQIVTAAARASPGVSGPARRQYVLFYRATLLLNRASVAQPDRSRQEYDAIRGEVLGDAEWPEISTRGIARARELLEDCIAELTAAIDEDLQEVEEELPGVQP